MMPLFTYAFNVRSPQNRPVLAEFDVDKLQQCIYTTYILGIVSAVDDFKDITPYVHNPGPGRGVIENLNNNLSFNS